MSTTPVNGKKLNEILELLRSQLESQQRQLDLLQGLAKSVVAEETPTLKPTPTHLDYIRAIKWTNEGIPDNVHLKELGRSFLKGCADRGELWFRGDAAERARLPKPVGEDSVVIGPRLGKFHVQQRLLAIWPESLGKLEHDTRFVWDSQLRIKRWQIYNGEGNPPKWLINLDLDYGYWESRWNPPDNRPGDFDCRVDYTEFGELILLILDDHYEMMNTIAFIALRLSSRYLGPSGESALTRVLLKNFTSDWESREKFVGYGTYNVTHTVRYFKYSFRARAEQVKQQDRNSSNAPIIRDRGTFERAHQDNEDMPGFLQEYRISLALAFDGDHRFPCFTVITLTDETSYILEGNMEGIRMDDYLNPFQVFIRKFDGIVQHVCRSWTDVVKGLDRELNVKFSALFDDSGSKRLMFDDDSFSRSKNYFQMQQVCRMFGTSIEETMRDIKEFKVEVLSWVKNDYARYRWGDDRLEGFEREFKGLSTEWDKYTTGQITKLNVVLELVQKKREVESLRDGLFSASSVREAARSTQMARTSILQNRYIFVFTVTTVIYLPLSFVTSIFGMHLFDTTDPGVVAARSKFFITIVILSVATYAAAFVTYWLVKSHKDDSPAETISEAKDRQDEGASEKVSGRGERASLASILKPRNHASLRALGQRNAESKKAVVSDYPQV